MGRALELGGDFVGPVHDNITCQVKIVGVEDEAVRVASVEAQERISDLFSYELDVGSDPPSVSSLEEALGADATVLLMRDGSRERIAHGIVTRVSPDGSFVGKGQARTRILIEPRLANLRYSGGYRIFQHRTVKEIVSELLAPERIDIVWRVLDELPKHAYRTQLDESDLDFVMRLVADEGLHFFFDHDDEKTTIVFTNEPLAFRELDGDSTFDFRDMGGVVTTEHIRRIVRAQQLRTGALEHRDYDFKNPFLKLVARDETPAPQNDTNTKRRERREYPGGFGDPDIDGNRRARRRLQELRSDAYRVEGAASSLRLLAGRAFAIAGHPDRAFNRNFVITEVRFSGNAEGALNGAPNPEGHGRMSLGLSSFVAIPPDPPIQPTRKPKPAARLQIARVVGPHGGDPFVDEFGRIKVQFPWDRDGSEDEHSSCWIRMSTPVAYDQGGFYSPHRVGSEVTVDFIDGDIDRPIVTGAVYNGEQRQFHKQPDEAAKSAWIERSVPGGKGYNGVTFDNTAGEEKIETHAELDRVTHVGRHDTETIRANQTTTVGANGASTIGANRITTIGANDTTTVGANRTETVLEKEDVTVKKGRTHTVEEGNDVLCLPHGDRGIDVYEGNHTLNAKLLISAHSDNHEIEARYGLHAKAERKIEVAQKGASWTMEDEHIIVQAPQHIVIDCPSGAAFFKDKKLTLQAVEELVLQCGQSAISLKKDGTVTIQGAKLISAAVSNSSIKLEPAKAAVAGASVEVSAIGQAKIAGAVVKIN